jgi:hypothetical protein
MCTVSRCLFNLFGFLLSATKFFMQHKHSGLSSPQTSIFVNRKDMFCVIFPAFRFFTRNNFIISWQGLQVVRNSLCT